MEFKNECEGLGLFQMRMPRFSQIYNFGEREVLQELGQSRTGRVVSCHAAEAYVKSGVHLESSCGISDVWYRYVELNAAKFGGLDSQAARFSSSTSTHPRPNEKQMEAVGGVFDWKKLHSRPLPTKIQRVLGTSTTRNRDGRDNAEDMVRDRLIWVGTGLIIYSKQKADRSEAKVQPSGSMNMVDMGRSNREVRGVGRGVEVKGGGNKTEVRSKLGDVTDEGVGEHIGIEGEGEKSDSSEFFLEDWPTIASFDNMENAVSELLRKSVVKGEKGEGVEKRGGVVVRGSEANGENGEKRQKRGLEEDVQDCKEQNIVDITYAELIFAADEVTQSSLWRANRSQKKEALGMLIKKHKERK